MAVSDPRRSVLGMENLVVETVSGTPVSFVRDGRTWHVAPDPVRWFERTSWWETEKRMPKGECVRIDVVVWQVQARIGHNPRSDLATFELVLGTDRQAWTVRSVAAVAV